MSTLHLLTPELRAMQEEFPTMDMSPELLPVLREMIGSADILGPIDLSGVKIEEIYVPGRNANDPEIRCRKLSPEMAKPNMPGILHIHGGGYIAGVPEMGDVALAPLVRAYGVTTLSVDYRLAPEHPHPAPLDDCYAALTWLHANAPDLEIDSSRIAVTGESAGGGLAAALVQLAVSEGDHPIHYQHLLYPMLDDRTGSDAQPACDTTGEFIWTRASNAFGWASYLGNAPREAPHVPARATDLSGLPRTWIGTATLDLFRDENIEYAQRLMAHGVPTELIVYPDAGHGFQAALEAPLTQRFWRDYHEAFARGLGLIR